MKINNVQMIDVRDWDKLVSETYQRPYNYQQQEGCQDRGMFEITIPSTYDEEADMNDSIPEEINGKVMGVKFDKWLERDPKTLIAGETEPYTTEIFWERNFYPSIHTVANALYNKGLIAAGEYTIKIDW